MEEWKKRLTEARSSKFPKKKDFAAAVGVSNPTVTDWEKSSEDDGITELTGKNLTKVCEVLNITAEWLLYGKVSEPTTSNVTPIYKRPPPINGEYLRKAIDRVTDIANNKNIAVENFAGIVEMFYEEYIDSKGEEMSQEKEDRIIRMVVNSR
jgi:transcriptional regulator with XRE-family HTH domain